MEEENDIFYEAEGDVEPTCVLSDLGECYYELVEDLDNLRKEKEV